MKSRNTFGIQFVLRLPKQKKEETAAVYARITVNGRRAEISLKTKVSICHWDVVKGKVKGKREETLKLNSHMEQVRSLIFDCYHQLIQQNKLVSVETVKAMYLGKDVEETMTLLKLVEYHKQIAVGKLAPGTMKNYFTTENYIKKFVKYQYRKTDIPLEELNYRFILDFEIFLNNHKPVDHQKPLNNNGIMKHMERLRKMVNLSVMMDWLDKDPFAKYKLRFEKVERGHLSKEELNVLILKSFSIERLQSVLDMFLFSCYTGLAYIDISNLTPENISKGIDGKDWLMTSRQKTDTTVRVPLLPEASTLIEKYKSHPIAKANGMLFPVVTNRIDLIKRPAIVDKKDRIGDLEIDLVIDKYHKGAMLRINDRANGL